MWVGAAAVCGCGGGGGGVGGGWGDGVGGGGEVEAVCVSAVSPALQRLDPWTLKCLTCETGGMERLARRRQGAAREETSKEN